MRRTRAEPQVALRFHHHLERPEVAAMRFCRPSVSQLSLDKNNEHEIPKKVQGDLYLHVMACWWRSHIKGATVGGERTDQVSVGPTKKH